MKIYALVEYMTRNGRFAVKGFGSKEETDAFVKRLEARGTEHLVTVL